MLLLFNNNTHSFSKLPRCVPRWSKQQCKLCSFIHRVPKSYVISVKTTQNHILRNFSNTVQRRCVNHWYLVSIFVSEPSITSASNSVWKRTDEISETGWNTLAHYMRNTCVPSLKSFNTIVSVSGPTVHYYLYSPPRRGRPDTDYALSQATSQNCRIIRHRPDSNWNRR